MYILYRKLIKKVKNFIKYKGKYYKIYKQKE